MANGQVTKIYELKTLGYDEVIRQLTSIETSFKNITDLKKRLNENKLTTQDADELIRLKQELDKAKLATEQLKLAKQLLTNEGKANANAKQAETNAVKANTAALKVEAGSYAENYARQKELYAALKNANPNSTVQYRGQTINFQQAVQEYKRLAAVEQDFRRQFQKDAVLVGEYTTGIIQAFQRLGLTDLLHGQLDKATASLQRLDSEFERLKSELNSLKAAGQPFDHIEQKLIANRNEAAALSSQISNLKTNMRGMGTVGEQITNSISKGFESMKQQLSQLVLTYVGFFAAFRAVSEAVKHNAELSDSFADLQIRIKGSAKDVANLFEQLKKIDTRTSLQGLVDIANIVAKKGVAKDDIANITQELDKLFVVLGKEAGDPAEATSSIVKLISIFNEDKHVTADRVNEIGTSLIKLTTSGVATGKFLIDFAERVGSVRGITGLTLPNILGMGAALEQLGQRAELAGTASIQLTTKLFSDVPKFAKAAGVSIEEFRKLLKDNPFDALVAVATKLANLGDAELGTKYEDIIAAFGDIGVKGARVRAVLGDIATNGKFVQERMAAAAVTTADLGNSAAAAELKQRTFAATLDRIKKQFETFATNSTIQRVMAAVGFAVGLLIQSIPTLVVLIGLMAVAWTVQNAALVIARLEIILYNIGLGALYITQGALYVLQGAYIVGLYALRAALAVVRIASSLLNAVFKATPLGLLVTGISLLIGVYQSFGQGIVKVQDATRKLTKDQLDNITQARIANEVAQKSIDVIGDQISKIEALVTVVTSSKTSYDVSKVALDQLIGSYSQFGAALDGTTIKLLDVKRILKEVSAEIQLNANAQAAASIAAEKYKQYLLSVTVRQKAERASSQGLTGDALQSFVENDLSVEERNIFLHSGTMLSPDQIKQLKEREQNTLDAYQDYNTFSSDLQGKLIKGQIENKKKTDEITELSAEDSRTAAYARKLSSDELEVIIKDIDKQYGTLKEGDAKLALLRKQRAIFQARLDALNPKTTKSPAAKRYGGARLTGQDKDELANIDADTNLLIAAEETRYAKLQVVMENGTEKLHEASYVEELQYLRNIRRIEEQGLKEKIAYLERKKNLNAKENAQLAIFYKEQANIELKYLKDLSSLNNSQFSIENNKLKKQLDLRIELLNEAQAKIELDPNVSDQTKAESKKATDDQILQLTEAYYVTLDALATKYSISNQTIEEEKQKAIAKITKDGLTDTLNITKAILADIEKAHERADATINSGYAKKIDAVLNSDLSDAAKKVRLAEIDRQKAITLAASAAGAAKAKYDQIKRDVAAGKASLEDLEKAEADYVNKSRALWESDHVASDTLKNIREGLTGFGESLAEQLGITGDAATLISQVFGELETALNSYFNNEEKRIAKSTELNKKRLDIELQQRKDRAQSSGEQASLDKQYAEKKDKLDRDAFEKNKKLQLKQLAINFAVQLSNIAVAASANPLNPFTFGSAGILQYIIQAALATGVYFLNRSSIKSQQFEIGGQIKGGRMGGKTHAQGGNPFMFKGRVFEDEVDELNIIRTKNVRDNIVHSISGTHSQIASKLNVLGGGVEFAPGARSRFATGGILGSSYQAPTYSPSNVYTPESLISEIRNLAQEQSDRIDRLQVYQVTSSVTKAQVKQVKQQEIGTI